MFLDLYGNSNKEDYEEIHKYYNDNLKVGGYLESVERYLLTDDVGLSNYLFEFYNENKNNSSEINGLINENFIFYI